MERLVLTVQAPHSLDSQFKLRTWTSSVMFPALNCTISEMQFKTVPCVLSSGTPSGVPDLGTPVIGPIHEKCMVFDSRTVRGEAGEKKAI